MGSRGSFYTGNETVYSDTNPAGPADAPVVENDGSSKGSFFSSNDTVYSETNPAGPADAPIVANDGASSSFYNDSGQQYAAIDLASTSVAEVEAAAAAAEAAAAASIAAKETGFGLAISVPGAALTANEWLFGHVFDVAVDFAANLSGSQATAGAGATGSPVLSIRKNGVQFATLTYSGTTGTFSGSATSFAIGDLLEMVAPASVDPTLARISITLFGTRT